MLHYLTLANWAGLWDDINGNHMIYYRITDKKWHWTLWDMDALFGQVTKVVTLVTTRNYLAYNPLVLFIAEKEANPSANTRAQVPEISSRTTLSSHSERVTSGDLRMK